MALFSFEKLHRLGEHVSFGCAGMVFGGEHIHTAWSRSAHAFRLVEIAAQPPAIINMANQPATMQKMECSDGYA